MRNPIPISRLISVFIWLIFPLVSCAQEITGQELAIGTELASLIQQINNRFLDEKLTVNDLQEELSSPPEQSENKQYWYINSDKYNVRVTAKAETKNSNIAELQFYTNDIAQLELKDLEKIFGNFRVFVRSKNTWIEFEPRKNKNNRQASIVAKLYAPPESKVSPVLMIKFRFE